MLLRTLEELIPVEVRVAVESSPYSICSNHELVDKSRIRDAVEDAERKMKATVPHLGKLNGYYTKEFRQAYSLEVLLRKCCPLSDTDLAIAIGFDLKNFRKARAFLSSRIDDINISLLGENRKKRKLTPRDILPIISIHAGNVLFDPSDAERRTKELIESILHKMKYKKYVGADELTCWKQRERLYVAATFYLVAKEQDCDENLLAKTICLVADVRKDELEEGLNFVSQHIEEVELFNKKSIVDRLPEKEEQTQLSSSSCVKQKTCSANEIISPPLKRKRNDGGGNTSIDEIPSSPTSVLDSRTKAKFNNDTASCQSSLTSEFDECSTSTESLESREVILSERHSEWKAMVIEKELENIRKLYDNTQMSRKDALALAACAALKNLRTAI